MRTTAELRRLWAPACTAPTVVRHLVPGIRISVDPRCTEAFAALGCVLQAHEYQVRREDTGSYNCRAITGGSGYSLHAFGIAVDTNWNSNPWRTDRLVTDMPRQMITGVLRIRTKDDVPVWRWGGDWDADPDTEHTAYDAMHFEVVASPVELEAGIDWDTVDQPSRDRSRPSTYAVLHPGDVGPTVRELQYILEIEADGIYGPATGAAVRAYQESHGLVPDGIVGLQSWTALLTDQPEVADDEPGPVKRIPLDLPEPDLADTMPPAPVEPPVVADRVQPRRMPVAELATPGEGMESFLRRMTKHLGPFASLFWNRLVSTILNRLEREAKSGLDRVFGPEDL